MNTITKQIRVYVACLATYNNGDLHGKWIDCTLGVDHLREEIEAMLKTSPVENAEEWAIHDYEGFGGVDISEWHNLEELAEMGELFDRCQEPELVQEIMSHLMLSPQDAVLYVEENYQGCHRSKAEWAENFLEDTGGLEGVPKHLIGYIDYAAYARDAELNGDIFIIEAGLNIHVFSNR